MIQQKSYYKGTEYIWDHIFKYGRDGKMENKDIDVLQVLKDKRFYHLEQVKRINLAIGALEGKPDKSKKVFSKRIQWKREVLTLLNEHDGLLPIEIRQKLAEKGITQALDENSKSSLYATLSRLSGKGMLKRAETGKYYKIDTD